MELPTISITSCYILFSPSKYLEI